MTAVHNLDHPKMTWYILGAGSALVFQRASKEATLLSRERK